MDKKRLQKALRECVVNEFLSFPNGSAYNIERMRSTKRFEIAPGGSNYKITDHVEQKQYVVWSNHSSRGPGAEFGECFCTRDQVLSALLPGNEHMISQLPTRLVDGKWVWPPEYGDDQD